MNLKDINPFKVSWIKDGDDSINIYKITCRKADFWEVSLHVSIADTLETALNVAFQKGALYATDCAKKGIVFDSSEENKGDAKKTSEETVHPQTSPEQEPLRRKIEWKDKE